MKRSGWVWKLDEGHFTRSDQSLWYLVVFINRLLFPVLDLSVLTSMDHGSVECGRPVSRSLMSVCKSADELTLNSQWDPPIVTKVPVRPKRVIILELSHLSILFPKRTPAQSHMSQAFIAGLSIRKCLCTASISFLIPMCARIDLHRVFFITRSAAKHHVRSHVIAQELISARIVMLDDVMQMLHE